MITALKPYPSTKDSGLPWLSQMPTHWDLLRGKFLFSCIDIRSSTGEEHLLTVSSKRGVVPRSEASVTMFKAESYVGHKLCWPGDLVINSLWAWAGGLGVSRHHGIVSTAYGVYRLRERYKPYARYVHELVRATPFNFELRVRSKGVWTSRLQLTDDAFLNAPLPIPPLAEQSAIVRFIAHIDEQTQRYIRAKQKLTALLQEQRRIVIQQGVSGQVDSRTGSPYPVYNDSRVDWMGKTPKHWAERSLGRCLRGISQGWSPNAAEGELEEDQWAVLTLSSVKRGTFDATAIKPIPISAKVPSGIEVRDGDLLLTRSNTRELVGDVCIAQGARPKTVICDLIYRLIPDTTLLNPKFLMFQLLSNLGRMQIERDARGSSGTMPKIAQRHIRSWRVLVPPLKEQQAAIEAIECATKIVDDAVKRIHAEVSLIDEYRNRLIADVVTGKLDVLGAEGLPPEIEIHGNAESLNKNGRRRKHGRRRT